MAVEPGEPGGRQRLVDRRPGVDPRIALRHRTGVRGELRRKRRVEQVGVARSAAVVQQSADRGETELAHAREARVGPRPVESVRRVGRDPFPQQRKANALRPQRRQPIDVVQPLGEAARLQLVEPALADAIDRRLSSHPQSESGCASGAREGAARRAALREVHTPLRPARAPTSLSAKRHYGTSAGAARVLLGGRPTARQRFSVRLSTASAASLVASESEGWAWQMRARSSDEAPNSIATTPSAISSLTQRTDDVHAEDAIGLRVGEDLHEADGVAQRARAGRSP